MQKLLVKKTETVKRWDYVKTFKPPMNLSIENGQIFQIVDLKPGSDEFNYVSKKFISTFGANPNIMPFGVNPILGGGGLFGAPGMGAGAYGRKKAKKVKPIVGVPG